jgi:low affinity Fe/Cu permease
MISAKDQFRKFAQATSVWVGTPLAFFLAALSIVIWLITGPMFHYSDTWQLIINTGTTIVTFLMVFLIQNAQNRDAKAIHLKLDELIRAIKGARNKYIDLEDLSDEELKAYFEEFKHLHQRVSDKLDERKHRRPKK